MNTKTHELENIGESSHSNSLLAGLLIGGLVGAGTVLLLAPQAGEKTRAELQQGVVHLRDRTSDTVKDTVTQVKSRANQIKADVQGKADELQHQGRGMIAKQLDRVAQVAEAGKKAMEEDT